MRSSDASRRSRILVVEDDPSIASELVRGLKRASFEVVLVTSGEQAMSAPEREQVDLVVLDLTLPDVSGFDLLDAWRGRCTTPVIVLTARTELGDRIRAFDLGAIDYLPKPFWMEELVTRIRLRLRVTEETERRRICWGGVIADLDGRVVQREGGEDLRLTSHEFNVLAYLLERAGSALTRAQIAERALPLDGERTDRTVDSHISHLRRKLGPAGARIRTIWGIGYRFEEIDET